MDVSDIDLRSVDHVLTTTRAVRRRLDFGRPVERELIERCIDIAIQAPTALQGETWHFVVITEQSQRAAVAQIYRRAGEGHRSGALSLDPYLASLRAEKPDAPRFAAQQRMFSSGAHLVRHMQDVPVLILACVEGRVENAGPGAQASLYGSIFPAVWSLMLAFRARGIGSVMTTQHIEHFEQDMATAVGLPDDMTQVALLAVAYFTGSDLSYGADTEDLTQRMGTYVGRILQGVKPMDLPIEQSTKVELVINLKTAKALGLTVPPSLLARADKVIE